jgi:hypothetical protein
MNEVSETTILEEGNVKITNLRAIISTKTYAMSNVTSVNLSKKSDSNAPLFLILGGILLGMIGLTNVRDYIGCLILAVLLVGGGILASKTAKPTYTVQIGSASGESNILESQDVDHIKRIVDAMNDAIVRRG